MTSIEPSVLFPVFVLLGITSADMFYDVPPLNTTVDTKARDDRIISELDTMIDKIKAKVGTQWSRNSALLHRMKKLDEYIKRGTDMETRYVLEIIGYPWDQEVVSPEHFLEYLATSLGVHNFTQSQVIGLRIVAGMQYSNTRLIVEFPTAKVKRQWLRGYKKKLYEVSWGKADPETMFGTKESFKTFHHKTVYIQDFLPQLCERHPVGVIPFAINDYISPYRKKLLSYAKLLAAHYKFRFVWVSEGDLFVRQKDGAPGTYIRSERDLRVFDWRLENEAFFWKIINQCNAERRKFLQQTTRRILPWMTRGEGFYGRTFPLTTSNLLVFKRKFDTQLDHLLQKAQENSQSPAHTYMKYNFYTLKIRMNQTLNRNYEIYKNAHST